MIIIRLTFWPKLVMWWRRNILGKQPIDTWTVGIDPSLGRIGTIIASVDVPTSTKSQLQIGLEAALAEKRRRDNKARWLLQLRNSITSETYEAMTPEERDIAAELLYKLTPHPASNCATFTNCATQARLFP